MIPNRKHCLCGTPSAPDYGGTSPETGEESTTTGSRAVDHCLPSPVSGEVAR